MISKINKKKSNKKGFTLIELIVVIAVLGILVLLAAPKFLGYVEEARVAHIKNDVKAYESAVTAEQVKDESYGEYYVYNYFKTFLTVEEIDELNESEDLVYDKTGLYEGADFEGEIYIIHKNIGSVNSKLDGTFLYDLENDEYYYYDGYLEGFPLME